MARKSTIFHFTLSQCNGREGVAGRLSMDQSINAAGGVREAVTGMGGGSLTVAVEVWIRAAP